MGAPATLLVSTLENLACVKVVGRANFAISLSFKRLVTELAQRGTKHFVIDLAQCQSMDSTFLGDLAGLGLQFGGGAADGRAIRLLNIPDNILDSIESLGTDRLFQVIKDCPDTGGFQEVRLNEVTREETTRNCLEAHRLLMSLDPANVDKFKDVTAFLEQDLKRQASAAQ